MSKWLICGILVLFTTNAYSQTVLKSYHPAPLESGAFTSYANPLKAEVSGDFAQKSNGRLLLKSGTATVEHSYFWDIVHKPVEGSGTYEFWYKYKSQRHLLGRFVVNDNGVTPVELKMNSRVATERWWPVNSTISYYNVGEYLALVRDLDFQDQNLDVQFRRCAELEITITGSLVLELVTVVVEKEKSCDEVESVTTPKMCVYDIQSIYKLSSLLRGTRVSTVVPFQQIPFFQYLNWIFGFRTRPAQIAYEEYYIAIQASLVMSNNSHAALADPVRLYLVLPETYGFSEDLTIAQALAAYSASLPDGREKIGSLLKAIVESPVNACNLRY